MSSSARRISFPRVLVDLNTQYDFLLPSGALPVANRGHILLNIRRLMNWARVERLPVVSTLEAHRAGESVRGLPPHCVDNSNGQKKLPFTLLPKRVLLYGDNTLDLPHEPFRRYQQIIFTKRHRDFLTNPKADRLIQQLDADHVIVFGVVGEYCVKAAALGLMARRQLVVLVTDACGYWGASDWELACRQMDAKGAVLVTTEELVSGNADPRILAAARPIPAAEEEDPLLLRASTTVPSNGNGNGNGHGKSNGHARAKPPNGRPADSSSGDLQLPSDAPDWTRPAASGKNGTEDTSGLVNPEILAREVRKAVRKARPKQGLA